MNIELTKKNKLTHTHLPPYSIFLLLPGVTRFSKGIDPSFIWKHPLSHIFKPIYTHTAVLESEMEMERERGEMHGFISAPYTLLFFTYTPLRLPAQSADSSFHNGNTSEPLCSIPTTDLHTYRAGVL